jgi:hypothetical protein
MNAEGETLTWRVHPAAERKATGAFVSLLLVALAVLAGIWMRGAYWGVFALFVLFLSLESFYLPTAYELTASGIVVRKPFSKAERPWSAFRSAWFDPLGVTLSPFGRRHWLETYRGVRVRFAARPVAGEAAAAAQATASPEAVRRFLRAHLDPQQVRFFGLAVAEDPTVPAGGEVEG